ncbi:MAG: ABC transporter ATP-binding protein [Actinomycetes bacterium]
MAQIQVTGVTKVFDGVEPAVNDLTLDVADGEVVVLVGPSGCGKSTLLRLVAGLEEVTAGEVCIGDRDVTDLPPKDRDIAMVFQNYALYPHMTVEQNIGFGLRLRKTSKTETAKHVAEVAKLLALDKLLDRKPAQLSGGERQRVAMGRAMVREPMALLMDEPLSNLDAKLRVYMRAELKRIHNQLRTTTLYVTHDQTEAMTLGDRVAVLRDGLLQQMGSPRELFDKPVNVFVASFMGSPAMNLTEAKVTVDAGEVHVVLDGQAIPAPDDVDLSGLAGGRVIVGFRPTDLYEAADTEAGALPTLAVTVDVVEELGTATNVLFRLGEAVTPDRSSEVVAQDVFTATVGAHTSLTAGAHTRLALDHRHLHMFDVDSGLSLRG